MSNHPIIKGSETVSEKSEIFKAKEILEEYPKPNSLIDNGNLYFAGCVYKDAFEQAVEKYSKHVDLYSELAGKYAEVTHKYVELKERML
jgi:hypothetical protein